MQHLLSFLLAIAFLANSAGAIVIRHDRDPRDYLADQSRFPSLFALYRTEAGHRDCIATLINPRWAVTAAHCTEDRSFTESLAQGGYRVEIGGRTALLDQVIAYPAIEGRRTPDLALLRFAQPVDWVAPLPLYNARDEEGREILIPGWGGTGNGLEGLGSEDGLFRVAENRIDAARDGFLIFQFDDPRSGTGRALAMEGASGPGDSGNPALIMTPQGFAVAGIGSAQRTYGRGEGFYGADEYFVRVTDFLPWIEAILAGERAPPASTDAAAIQIQSARFSQALVAGDIDTAVSIYAENGVAAPSGLDFIRGREALRTYWTPAPDSDLIRHAATPIAIVVDGGHAFDWGYYSGTTIMQGEERSFRGKYVIVWRREEDGVWRMVQDMWNSLPSR